MALPLQPDDPMPLLHLRASCGLGLALVLGPALACSATAEPPPERSALRAVVEGNVEGETLAILPFDPTNAACAADPFTMDRSTFAACAHFDPAKLPAELHLIKNPAQFEPKRDPSAILLVNGLPVDPAHPEVTWHAIISLGRQSSKGDPPLVQSLSVGGTRLQAVPLLVGGGLLLAPEATTALLTALGLGAVVAAVGTQVVVNAPESQRELVARDDEARLLEDTNAYYSAFDTRGAKASATSRLDSQPDKPSTCYAYSAASCSVKGDGSLKTPWEWAPNPGWGSATGPAYPDCSSQTIHQAEQEALDIATRTAGLPKSAQVGDTKSSDGRLLDSLGPGFRRFQGGQACKVHVTCWVSIGPEYRDAQGNLVQAAERGSVKCNAYGR